ncbi:hypothetical protein FN846DRAFT_892863 [Sphaerosporella brunnea]|uniref:Uncharacterized protein n=1 Tax=Sphaerosporella brunnea TaxID=1250544 RepID=A0A5J5ENU2_9PEZI|nr:hypothetical protein FN846DRAFT_892863 [Sphaerosporella brunnea]
MHPSHLPVPNSRCILESEQPTTNQWPATERHLVTEHARAAPENQILNLKTGPSTAIRRNSPENTHSSSPKQRPGPNEPDKKPKTKAHKHYSTRADTTQTLAQPHAQSPATPSTSPRPKHNMSNLKTLKGLYRDHLDTPSPTVTVRSHATLAVGNEKSKNRRRAKLSRCGSYARYQIRNRLMCISKGVSGKARPRAECHRPGEPATGGTTLSPRYPIGQLTYVASPQGLVLGEPG